MWSPQPPRQAGVITVSAASQGIRAFCLITTSSGRHWTFPKGVIERGASPRETALNEALEEAGLHGTIVDDVIGSFEQTKWGETFWVAVYLMEVTTEDRVWEEQGFRRRRWCGRRHRSGSHRRSTGGADLSARHRATLGRNDTRRIADTTLSRSERGTCKPPVPFLCWLRSAARSLGPPSPGMRRRMRRSPTSTTWSACWTRTRSPSASRSTPARIPVAISANDNIDFVFYDMEHGPFDVTALRTWMQWLLDPGAIAKAGSPAATKAVIVRIPASGRELEHNTWMVKQILDTGAHGIIFPTIETPDQALTAVRAMRYPQPVGATETEPAGLRGTNPRLAARYWGLSVPDYTERADIWRLDPENGNLLPWILIESPRGVANVRAIARELKAKEHRRRAVCRIRDGRGHAEYARRRPSRRGAGDRRLSSRPAQSSDSPWP